jgi:hypothetical protein
MYLFSVVVLWGIISDVLHLVDVSIRVFGEDNTAVFSGFAQSDHCIAGKHRAYFRDNV